MTKEEIQVLIDNKSTKYCKSCDLEKSYSEFYIKHTKNKPNSYRANTPCKNCSNKKSEQRKLYEKFYNLENKYGITKEEYIKLHNKQNGCCAICNKPESVLGKSLSLDHCHTTNKIRGLLCTNCNLGIGYLKDSIEYLNNSIRYLSIS